MKLILLLQALTRQAVTLILLLAVCGAGYFWVRERAHSKIYEAKINYLIEEHNTLISHYNEAIRQTAVTELEVTENSVAIRIKTLDGAIQRIETPFHPKEEIYVDYVVDRGRLWIRRIFDQKTAPEKALVIDPTRGELNWSDSNLRYGKAIYRSLSPGIWSIQVSGNGSLDLQKIPTDQRPTLETAPSIQSYEEWTETLDQTFATPHWTDLWSLSETGFGKTNNPKP